MCELPVFISTILSFKLRSNQFDDVVHDHFKKDTVIFFKHGPRV